MPEQKIEFTALEVRGIYMQQQALLNAACEAERAAKTLQQAEAESAELLKGRVPAGVTIRMLRIDQATSSVYADVDAAPPKARKKR